MKKNFFLFLAVAFSVTFLGLQHATAQNTSPYWSLAGNSNASAASSKLGTTNSIPVRLFTNNSERIRISPAGNVGVNNTGTPGRLTVQNAGGTPSGSWITSSQPLFAGYAEGGAGNGDYLMAMASNSHVRSVLIGRRSRGTLAAPTVVQDNDFLFSFLASGHDGSAFQNPATIDMFVDGTPSAGNVPARISFVTGSNIGNRQERLVIKSNGFVGVGTTSPVEKLHVEGGGIFANNTSGNGVYAVGTNFGVYGQSNYLGVYGNGGSYGVYGGSSSGYGVYGNSGSSSGVYGTGNTYGVEAYGGYGVYASGVNIGAYATASSSTGYGLYGDGYLGTYGSGSSYGTYGYSSAGYGASGISGSYIGVYGSSNTSWGVYGTSNSYRGVQGFSNSNIAGYFQSGSWHALWAKASTAGTYAGVFEGNIYAFGTYTSSDKNLKKNIEEVGDAMTILNKLKPKYYEFKTDGKYASLSLPKGKHYGFLAQELEEVLPNLIGELKSDISSAPAVKTQKLITPKGQEIEMPVVEQKASTEQMTTKAINYVELIPILVKALQEQQVEINELKSQMSRLTKDGVNNTLSGMGVLGQNSPNPVRNSTRIAYNIPSGTAKAQLMVTDNLGKMLQLTKLDGSGYINLNTASLSSGVYNYSLVVDGKTVETKKMTVIRN